MSAESIDAPISMGARKAAAVLLAMDRTTATQLLRHFSPRELREVTMAAARLGSVAIHELETIVEEFTADFSQGASLLGDEGQARALIADVAPPDQIETMLAEPEPEGPPDVWRSAGQMPEATLTAFLKDEHPLIATYILSRLEAGVSARVVATLPRELRNQVLIRLLAPRPPSPAGLVLLETAVRDALLGGTTSVGGEGDDSRARIAEIINGLDGGEADEVMRMLEAARPKDAEAVRKMLFSFNDLPRLTQRARALLFDKISTDAVVLALRGMDAEFREPVLSAMASRSRRLVESELANPSSAPASETVKARKEIVKQVLAMAQRNEIELPSNEEAEGQAA